MSSSREDLLAETRAGKDRRPRRSCGGIFTRKERWGLSWYGWLALLMVVAVGAWGALISIYPYLALTTRADGENLVVEGWIHDYAIRCSKEEFRTGGCKRIFVTGGPVSGMGGYTNDYNTSASVGAARLRAAGIPEEMVQMVPCRISRRDRTYASAIALRDWWRENHVEATRFNVVTEAAHARRTQLLFQRAFGPHVRVGVIAVQNPDYNPDRWWGSSEGFREVISETLALAYAEFLFRPDARDK